MNEKDTSYRLSPKGIYLMALKEENDRIRNPLVFKRILAGDPLTDWLFEELFLFTYAKKIKEKNSGLTFPKDNYPLINLFYWKEYKNIAILRQGVTEAQVKEYIIQRL